MTKEQMIQENGKKLLLEIRGARLSSVQFVLDYLILGFDEKGALTTLVWPEIMEKGDTDIRNATVSRQPVRTHYEDS